MIMIMIMIINIIIIIIIIQKKSWMLMRSDSARYDNI